MFISTLDFSLWWPGIILLGIIIGFLTGLYGVGGGFLLTPALKILFGIPYPIAIGSSIVLITCNAIVASWEHHKKRNVDFALGGVLAIGSIIGAEIGVRLLQLLQRITESKDSLNSFSQFDTTLNFLFLALMVWVAISLFREIRSKNSTDEVVTPLSKTLQNLSIPPQVTFKRSNLTKLSLWVPLAFALFAGIFTGLLGIGGGFINLPLLIYGIGVPTLVAVGTTSFQIFFAAGYGSFRHMINGNVSTVLAGLLFVGSLVGVKLGAMCAHRFGGKQVRHSFIVVILLGITIVLWDVCKGFFG